MKFVVIGSGMMGSAVARDLITSGPDDEVVLADIDADRAAEAARSIGPAVRPARLDANSEAGTIALVRGSHAVVGAASYQVNLAVTRAAIAAGVHCCDLGGNNDVVDRQHALDADAKSRGVTVIPNTGLAPGLINILAVTGMREFETVDAIRLRVGGLPQHPRPPLNYQIVFSVEGLLNEYLEPVEVIRNGRRTRIPAMSELEELRFPEPFGTLEAFSTSGGLSTLASMLEGKVEHLDYKTIRYPGHCEKFRTLLDLGFAASEPLMIGAELKTARDLFPELLRRKLDYGDRDVVLARATLSGTARGARRTLVYECIDLYDEETSTTAMMRTTAFPASITARMLADGTIHARGVVPPELSVPGDVMIRELRARNVRITTSITDNRE